MKFNKIAKPAVVIAALLLVFGFNTGGVWAKEKFEEKFEKTESLARDGKVIISNISGGIVVKSWDKAEVQIAARKVSEASSLDRAKENCGKVTIEVTKSGNILQIETRYPERTRNLSVSVYYDLFIPDKASIKAKSISGNVDAQNIGGTFEGNITSGNAVLAKIAGGADCRTVSGRINVQDVSSDIDLKTVSGTIEAARIKGSVEAETTSGHIQLRDISEARTVRVKVLSGKITYEGQIYAGGKYNFETLSGGIDVILPANAAFELDAETFSGHVNSEFPITVSGKISPRELRGVVSNGGASLRLKTFSGTIDIKKR